jgi:hypothetical protein
VHDADVGVGEDADAAEGQTPGTGSRTDDTTATATATTTAVEETDVEVVSSRAGGLGRPKQVTQAAHLMPAKYIGEQWPGLLTAVGSALHIDGHGKAGTI